MNIKEVTKKDGTKMYRTNAYLGVDTLTGKQVRTSITATTRKMCEIKANQAINKFIKNGSTIAREKVEFNNFKELTESWFDNYKLSVKISSVKATSNYLKVYILPALGDYKPSKITSMLLQQIVNQWARNANTSKIINGRRGKGKGKDFKLWLNIIKRIFDYGKQLGAITDNPAIQVISPKLKAREVKKIKYFTDEELKKFLTYLDTLDPTITNELNATLYRFLLATGLRIGEALALNWSDIDFTDKSVSINKTTLQTGEVQEGAKTKESNRVVALDDDTVIMMKKWKKLQDGKMISLNDKVVFADKDGKHFWQNTLNHILNIHFDNAGVPHIGFHGFRHTHASLLMNNDVNPKEIQERLGHADYSITMNTYSHLAKDKKKDTAEKFSNILKAL